MSLAEAVLAAVASLWGPPGLVDDPSVPVPVDSLRSFAETEAAMDALLLARFPPGSDPAALRRALARDGFAVVGTEATRIVDPWMCRLEWDVTWTEKVGALGPVDASLGGACM